MTLQPGAEFDKYRVIKKLGAGGFGAVYHVEHVQMRELAGDASEWQLALKLMLPQWASQEAVVQRFVREMNLAKKLNHPNGVPIRDVGVFANQIYYTMDLVDGETLSNVLHNRGCLTPEAVVKWGVQALNFLHYLHTEGHLHRDIKPGNLMLEETADGTRVRVLDLGIAREIQASAESDLTGGGVIGTPEYMAPEYIAGEEPDHRVDIFAMGVVLYKCATAISPFAGDSQQSTWHNVVTATPKPIRQCRAGFPPAVAEVIHAAMAKAPADRPQTAAEFARRLQEALAQDPPKSRVARGLLLVVLAIGAGFGIWHTYSSPTTEKEPSKKPVASTESKMPIKRPPEGGGTTKQDAASDTDKGKNQPPPPLVVELLQPVAGQSVGKQCELAIKLTGAAPFSIVVGEGEPEVVDQESTFKTNADWNATGNHKLHVVVTDANGIKQEIDRTVNVDLVAPSLRRELEPRFTWSDDTPIQVELEANETLGPDTLIDGAPTIVLGKIAKATIARGDSAERTASITLTDQFGNARKLQLALKRSRIPAGLKPLDRTGADQWQLGWATPLLEPRSGIVVHLQPPTSVVNWPLFVGAIEGDKLARDNEAPRKRVTISKPFYIGESEVTRGQWHNIAKGFAKWGRLYEPSFIEGVADAEQHPATTMSWPEAVAFCEAIGGRLPTECEWEWCARREAGNSNTLYAWGQDFAGGAGFCNSENGDKHEVSATPLDIKALPRTGLRHLHGNVIEWCQDVESTPPGGLQTPATDPCYSPPGTDHAKATHIGRGGSWQTSTLQQRISHRFKLTGQNTDVGLRIVFDVSR